MALTAKQQRFVAEYLIDLNATQAAIRAGYSAKTAYSVGHENLKKPEVQAELQVEMKARSERTEIDADWVLKRLARDATADLADLYDEHGNLLPVKQWPIAWRTGLVAGVETVQDRDGEDAEGNPVYVRVKGEISGATLSISDVEQFGSPEPVMDCAMTGVVILDGK